jgi:hypothetical protein
MVFQMVVVVVPTVQNIGSMVCLDKLKHVAREILDGAHSPNESLWKATQFRHRRLTAIIFYHFCKRSVVKRISNDWL